MKFEDAVEVILEHEGGYVNNKFDDGGETNFGISKRAYPNLDIENLTRQDAINIYKSDYWDAYRLDEIVDPLRLIFFDAIVNHGATGATRILQSAVGVETDGLLGPKTIDAIYASHNVVSKFAYARWRFYAQHSKWTVFGQGWTKRLFDVAVKSVR